MINIVPRRSAPLLFLLITCSFVQAQLVPVPQKQVPRLPAIDAKVLKQKFDKEEFIEHLQAKFARITSYGYTYHISSPENRSYFVECWKEMGAQYYHETEEPSQKLHDIFTFDGSVTKTLRGDNGEIWIKKGEFAHHTPAAFWQSPLEIYAFLNCNAEFLSLKRLSSGSPLWKDLAMHLDYAGKSTFLNRDCVVLRFLEGFDQNKSETATYDVYFDSATMMPLCWQAYDEQGYMIDELALTDLQPFTGNSENGPLPFVPRFTYTQYQSRGTLTINNKVIPYFKSSCQETFDEVALNTLTAEDLQLDESQAVAIIDQDTQKVTRLKH